MTDKTFRLDELEWILDMANESTGYWPEFNDKVERLIREEKNDADKTAT